MTLPASDERSRLDLEPVFTMFRRANEAVKSAENACGKFVASLLNEFRMAFYHVAEAHKEDSTSDGLVQAVRHCRRAYYDAREIEVLAKLEIIKDFDLECFRHEDVAKRYIRDYTNKRRAALAAQTAIKEASLIYDSREEQYEKYDPHCKALEDYCEAIKDMQLVISTAIRKQKIKSICLVAGTVTGAIIAIAAVTGLIINWLR